MAMMTEEEWLVSTDPHSMVYRRCRRVIMNYPRKGHLFAVACCRRIWHLLGDQRSRNAVEVAAQYAEGLVGEAELQAAADAAQAAHREAFEAMGKVKASAEWAAQYAAAPNAFFAASRASNFAYVAAGDGLLPGPEHISQSHLLRCVFGPLAFRPVIAHQSWLTWNGNTIPKLAQAIYNEQTFHELPILADALEDAGCDNIDILNHCRSGGEHVRGCWVIDLVLEKK